MSEESRQYDFYQLLGVPRTASNADIKAAYRDLAQIYHPDSNYYDDLLDESMVALTPEQDALFKRITHAYHTLVSEDSRAEYDTTLAPALAGWTETNLKVTPEEIAEAKNGAAKPFAYGTFGKVSPRTKSGNDMNHYQECTAVSDLIDPKKQSLFARLCSIFGI